MNERSRWPREGWISLVAGLAWLWAGATTGAGTFLLSLAPGVLLVAAGAGRLLLQEEPRLLHLASLGGAVGVLFGLVSLIPLSIGGALLLTLLSAVSYVAAGTASVRDVLPVEDVPPALPSLGLAAKVAADDAILAGMGLATPLLEQGDSHEARIVEEVEAARELFESRGFLEKPESYHSAPLPLDAPQITRARVRLRRGAQDYEHLRFESEYEPAAEEPGRDRWLSYTNNRTAHAWVVRHRDEGRPWIVCIHGYQMGRPMIDLGAFDPSYFHHELGLNMLAPVLPLHGPRKRGRVSGDGFLSGDVLDSIHAEAQAMWDIRRMLSWIRAQGAPAIAVHGLSLGGYTTALLACLDDDLACAVPGIPATDFGRLFFAHGPAKAIRRMESLGLSLEKISEVMRVVSPLALEPKVPLEHRAIFGGVADRLVPADQVRDLWEHWERPRIVWYQGSHITFMLDPRVREALDETLRSSLNL